MHTLTQAHIHTLAQIQQQSIYIYTKCTNLVIVRLTQWDKKAVEGEECEYERAQWWSSSAEYGRRQTSRKSCLRWWAHKSRQRYLLKAGRGDNMFTHMLECLHASVCVSERACRYAATAWVYLCVCVFARMSFVFLEQTLIVFDFSKDSSDAPHSRSAWWYAVCVCICVWVLCVCVEAFEWQTTTNQQNGKRKYDTPHPARVG